MGRPLRKDVNGVDVINTFVGAETGIRVAFHNGDGVQTDGIIIKQRGSRTFVVAKEGTPLTKFPCVMVTGTPADGQMRMTGSIDPDAETPVLISIAKITKRVATDFEDNRYTWELVNTTADLDAIKLTAIV